MVNVEVTVYSGSSVYGTYNVVKQQLSRIYCYRHTEKKRPQNSSKEEKRRVQKKIHNQRKQKYEKQNAKETTDCLGNRFGNSKNKQV